MPTPLVTVGNVLAFTDASVANGTTYRYRVSAISAAGEGAQSAEVVRRARDRADRPPEPDGDHDQVRHRADLDRPVVERRHARSPGTASTAARRAAARRST